MKDPQKPHASARPALGPGLEEKVRFLSAPATHGQSAPVRAIETHMSWLFLTGELVYKLKKPVRYPFLDFTNLERRAHFCNEELRLNRRLAPEVYRRVVPLRVGAKGELSLGNKESGEIIDWLVEMRQLSGDDMLDDRLRAGRVTRAEVVAALDKLVGFYAAAEPERRDGPEYIRHLEIESAVNRRLLSRDEWDLPQPRTRDLLDRVDALLARARPMILDRIAAGRIIEGHGDLRPEHIHIGAPPQIIDCLEFDRSMRLLDPYDELNYLGMECEMLGADWVRPLALDMLDAALHSRPEPRLMATYGAFRAMLRARICMAHLLDPEPMTPEIWPAEARHYFEIAERECLRAEA